MVHQYKYYVFGHYPSSRLYLKTVLFIFKTQRFETGFCLRLQVKPTLLGSIDKASPYSGQDKTMDMSKNIILVPRSLV
jgi:hypothetical protein